MSILFYLRTDRAPETRFLIGSIINFFIHVVAVKTFYFIFFNEVQINKRIKNLLDQTYL